MAPVLQYGEVGLKHLVKLLREAALVLHLASEDLEVSVVHFDHGGKEVSTVLEDPVWNVSVTADCLV